MLVAAWMAIFLWPLGGAAEPRFGPELREPIVDHFRARLESEECARYFRFEGAQIVDWRADDKAAQVEVVFFVSYISDRAALYRDAQLTAYCLGGHHGHGFFEHHKIYRTVAQIYSLSKWASGWHVDRVDIQP
jgi:hypothetical protein